MNSKIDAVNVTDEKYFFFSEMALQFRVFK
jgi:hypothetical protein